MRDLDLELKESSQWFNQYCNKGGEAIKAVTDKKVVYFLLQ